MLKSGGYNLWSSQNCSKHPRLIILRQLSSMGTVKGMDYHPQHRRGFICNATTFILAMQDNKRNPKQGVKQLSSIDSSGANPVYTSGNLAHLLEGLNNLQKIGDNGSHFLWTTLRSHWGDGSQFSLFPKAHLFCKSLQLQTLHFQFCTLQEPLGQYRIHF